MNHQMILATWLALLVCQTPSHEAGEALASPAKTLTLAQMWALNATYTDKLHGVVFHYPSVWQATTQVAYHSPALARSDFAKPIAGFGYRESGFPRAANASPYSGTSLEGVSFAYLAVPAASTVECEAKAASLSDSPKHSKIAIGGRSFSLYKTGEGGMSQSISGDLYATYANRTCYFFETDVATVSSGVVDGMKTLDPPQTTAIFGHLTDLMRSVRITKGTAPK